MKKITINKLWIALLGMCLCFAMSCQKALDINNDPNKPATATPKLVLPTAQVGMALAVGHWNYNGSMWAQYWTGGQGVGTANLERYNMTGSDVETAWSHAYSKALADMNFLIKSDQPVYAGMGKIMSAYLYQMLVDLFGDVPYSEALKGAPEDGGILAPKFDDPKAIYGSLINMLDEGINNVQETGVLIESPGSEDLLYGGNINKWIAFANTIKLKLYVRADSTANAIALINSGAEFINSSSIAKVDFTESAKNANPLYTRFDGSGLGMYYVAAAASIDYLKSVGDPRIDALYTKPTAGDSTGVHVGIRSGQVNIDAEYELVGGESADDRRKEYSNISSTVYNFNIPVYFITASESKFLQAEAVIKNSGDATTLVNDGIQESFDIFNMSAQGPGYITTLAFNSSATKEDQLDFLGIQKWIAMNGIQMIEGWLETVRFDRPSHFIFSQAGGIFTNPTQNVLGVRVYPSSFVYPTQEVASNPNTPAGRAVTDKRFWDL